MSQADHRYNVSDKGRARNYRYEWIAEHRERDRERHEQAETKGLTREV